MHEILDYILKCTQDLHEVKAQYLVNNAVQQKLYIFFII